ncbi:hypothetical protein [Tychonema sp. BBK16]|nr:hypothetical protein [Tychonema sp. BBK16]MCF6374169.1 hypothetical protein [Tychonema sp. BBK16]
MKPRLHEQNPPSRVEEFVVETFWEKVRSPFSIILFYGWKGRSRFL